LTYPTIIVPTDVDPLATNNMLWYKSNSGFANATFTSFIKSKFYKYLDWTNTNLDVEIGAFTVSA